MVASGTAQHLRALFQAQPVARPLSELLHAFDPTDPGCQVGTQQTRVCGLMRQSPHRGQLLIDGVGCEPTRLQVHAIAHDDDAVESQAGSEQYQ